jgi:hypothetical protein
VHALDIVCLPYFHDKLMHVVELEQCLYLGLKWKENARFSNENILIFDAMAMKG